MRLHLAATGRIVALAAVVAATALLAPATATAARPAAEPTAAHRIELVRSGGFAGATSYFAVDRHTPGSDAAFALMLAARPDFRALAPSYEPTDLCCDHFRYVVTVSYADRSTKTVTTWSHAAHPLVLASVIASTERGASTVPAAHRIDLTRSGGFAGVTRRFVVDRTNAAPDAGRVLMLAGLSEFRVLDSVYFPPRRCCDHFQYDLTVLYSDGASKKIRTWSNAEAPAILFEVIRLTQVSGQPPAK